LIVRDRFCKSAAFEWTGRIVTDADLEKTVVAFNDDLIGGDRLAGFTDRRHRSLPFGAISEDGLGGDPETHCVSMQRDLPKPFSKPLMVL
jgi:hypothetical protein